MTERTGKAFSVAAGQPWAIQAEALEQILTIAAGYADDPKALEARLGRPLQNTRNVTMHGDGVAVIPVSGPIFHRANMFTEISGATSTEMLALDLNQAVENPAVKSILLNIGSPGGQVAGTSEIAGMIAEARDAKPIVAYIDSIGASGAYWIASAADYIYINNTAMAGSIGVVMSAPSGKDARRIEIVSSNAPKKRVDPATDEGRAEIQTLVDRLEVEFIDAVAMYRGVDSDDVRANFGQGGLLVGSDAVEAGMVDEVSTFENIISGLSGQPGAYSMPTAKQAGSQPVTIDTIKAEHPDVANALIAEGESKAGGDTAKALESARAEAAEAERARIQSVHEQGAKIPGHEALIAGLMFDGKTTGPEAAVQILAAEAAARDSALKDIKAGAVAPAPVTPATEPKAEEDFWALVDAEIEGGLKRSDAIRKISVDYPQAHQKMIASGSTGAIN